MKIPTVLELLKAGVHFGHRTNRWTPKMSKYIYREHNGIHVIDLSKTIENLQLAIKFLNEQSKGTEVLFVGTKRQAREVIENLAGKTGAHFIINRWPGGLLTNFKIHSLSIRKLMDLEEDLASGVENRTKQEIVWLNREKDRLERLFGGVRFMGKLPGVLVVVDPKSERIAVREANKMGIPVVALVDTNTDPGMVDYVIPANDDALKSLSLLLKTLSAAVEEAKGPSLSIVRLRRAHEEKLAKLTKDASIKAELKRKEEERRRQELKDLKEGKEVSVVRVDSGVKVLRSDEAAKTESKNKSVSTPDAKKPAKKESTSSKGADIDKLKVSSRVLSALKKAGYNSIDDVKKLSEEELNNISGIGEKAVLEIKKAL